MLHKPLPYEPLTSLKVCFWGVLRFHLLCGRGEKPLVAPGSCCLRRTAAVQALYCLTEKTGLHQGSLEVKHNTKLSKAGQGRSSGSQRNTPVDSSDGIFKSKTLSGLDSYRFTFIAETSKAFDTAVRRACFVHS